MTRIGVSDRAGKEWGRGRGGKMTRIGVSDRAGKEWGGEGRGGEMTRVKKATKIEWNTCVV